MNVGSLFSGAGLMDWGLTLAGFEHAWFCESNPFCRSVLELRWPGVPVYDDVRAVDGSAPRVDVIAGGFPCQPFSAAGKQRGLDDERWLWPEFARTVRDLRPRYVIVENVPGLLAGHGGMGNVLGDLAALGYDAEWGCLSAASAGAPHLRERVFVVAYADGSGREPGKQDVQARQPDTEGRSHDLAYTNGERLQADQEHGCDPSSFSASRAESALVQDADSGTVQPRRLRWGTPRTGSTGWWAAEPDVGRVAHGVPDRLHRLTALGNGVIPQISHWLGERIFEAEAMRTTTAPLAAHPPLLPEKENTHERR